MAAVFGAYPGTISLPPPRWQCHTVMTYVSNLVNYTHERPECGEYAERKQTGGGYECKCEHAWVHVCVLVCECEHLGKLPTLLALSHSHTDTDACTIHKYTCTHGEHTNMHK